MGINWLRLLDGSDEGTQSKRPGSSASLTWGVQGTNDLATMHSAVWSEIPATYNDGLKILVFQSVDRRQLADKYWEWTAHYVDPEKENEQQQDPDTVKWDYDTTGGRLLIRYSRQTVASYGANPPNHQNAIDVQENDVKGAEIVIPALKFTATYRRAAAMNPITRGLALSALTGTVNNAEFWGIPEGEFLFLGARGGWSFQAGLQESLEFLHSENAAGLAVGQINNIDKEGHQFLWIAFEPAVDGGANRMARRPKWVYVERLYEKTDFTALGIGTGS